MIEEIINFLDAIYPMSEALKDDLRSYLTRKVFPKNTKLLREGQICRYVYFITKGLVRAYINKYGKEINVWFMMENDVMVAVDSVFSQTPGEQFIEALEDTEVYCITYECLQMLYRKHLEFNIHRSILLEKYYPLSEKRAISVIKHTAEEKYQYLLEHHPEWLNRVPLNHLASYLGMSAHTLSRARAKY